MSAPGIGKDHFALPDMATLNQLPKPVKALVYLVMLSVLTVAAVSALARIGYQSRSFGEGGALRMRIFLSFSCSSERSRTLRSSSSTSFSSF
ncbi:MAG: hypothetical protein IJH84_02740, partial [Saccharopolyspora sp.]|uniref:hypothetical protein n=1 Tax=Saccharopolyspora sp. TaxID=33915 RepID=UPI0025CEE1BA